MNQTHPEDRKAMSDTSPVLHYSIVDDSVDQYATATLTPADDLREKIVLSKPYVIPIVFLPGIMGTNLRKKNGNQSVGQPPNADLRGALDMIAQLFGYVEKTTIGRSTPRCTQLSRSRSRRNGIKRKPNETRLENARNRTSPCRCPSERATCRELGL
ncbi:hypothetical protein PSAC2689_200028 [Paraburkholderia sacchari]|uniref:hypothetical protein n=1 Tax=Paraburkholderia sacchari TaxID=159450 RepID=UPI0039A4F7F2